MRQQYLSVMLFCLRYNINKGINYKEKVTGKIQWSTKYLGPVISWVQHAYDKEDVSSIESFQKGIEKAVPEEKRKALQGRDNWFAHFSGEM